MLKLNALHTVRLRPSTWFFLALAVLASAPAWIVKHPPLEDMPFHLSAIRVLHNFGDAPFNFGEHFTLTLGRTQYVFYYLLGSLFSYGLGVKAANVLMMALYLGGTPLALRDLLLALDKDERLAIFVIPLLVNVMFIFGLLPFVFGIPLMFWGLATAARYFEAPSRGRGVLLGALALALFYCHIFPFGLFALGVAALFPWLDPRRWPKLFLPFLPTALVVLRWVFFTEAGSIARGTLGCAIGAR